MSPEFSDGFETEGEYIMDQLYFHREYVMSDDVTWNIREEHWVAIDGLLDRFNEIRNVGKMWVQNQES